MKKRIEDQQEQEAEKRLAEAAAAEVEEADRTQRPKSKGDSKAPATSESVAVVEYRRAKPINGVMCMSVEVLQVNTVNSKYCTQT